MKTNDRQRLSSTVMHRALALGQFNPAVPEDGSLIEAEPLRDQFNSLKAMIDECATEEYVIQARNDAIAVAEANCASECDSVELLQFNAQMTYDQNQFQDMIYKINELINALKG